MDYNCLFKELSYYIYQLIAKQHCKSCYTELIVCSITFFQPLTLFIDFRIVAFQKKTDAACVCLILDTQGMEEPYKGPGYHHPDKQVEQPTGLESYPAIYSYPTVKKTLFQLKNKGLMCKGFCVLLISIVLKTISILPVGQCNIRLSVQMSCKFNFSLTDELILMKLSSVAVNDLRLWI